ATLGVDAAVLHHVAYGVPYLAGRAKDVGVVAVREDGALPPGGAVQPLGDSYAQALHRAGKRSTIDGLDDQVDVVRLDRVLRQAHPQALTRRFETLRDHPYGLARAKVRNALADANGHVNRCAAGKALSPHVRDARTIPLRLPTCALSPRSE